MACGTQARRPAAEIRHFSLIKIHCRVQSPVRSVISFFTTPSESLLFLSLQPPVLAKFSFSKVSSSPCLYHALIRRVSGSRQATMCSCRCDLCGVIQLITFLPFFGKQNKLDHPLRL